jgi:hypothetical protein
MQKLVGMKQLKTVVRRLGNEEIARFMDGIISIIHRLTMPRRKGKSQQVFDFAKFHYLLFIARGTALKHSTSVSDDRSTNTRSISESILIFPQSHLS